MAREGFDDYEIQIRMSAKLTCDGDERDYITTIDGQVFTLTESDNFSLCGKLQCWFVNLDQVHLDGFDYFCILDAHSRELSECAGLFKSRFSFGANLKKTVCEALRLNDYDSLGAYDNFIYIQRLEVLPKHRGKGLGQFFLNETLKYLAKQMNFDFFVMKPFPLQSETFETKKGEWRYRLALDKLEPNHKKALMKLQRYYAELGFVAVKGTDLMICRSDYFLE